jgi:hypothetical protein
VPLDPDVPDEPDVPLDPDVPELPEDPELPDVPLDPDVPEDPLEPETVVPTQAIPLNIQLLPPKVYTCDCVGEEGKFIFAIYLFNFL